MKSNVKHCMESWAQELKSRSDRVRDLIGAVHWLSDGHHKEDLLRQFLLRHLPPRLRVTRGFIRSGDGGGGVSREIDAMVSDSEAELPWFMEGGLVIAPPTAVLAQIHVKTEFGVAELADVLISGAHNEKVFNATVSNRALWFGGIFFSAKSAKSTAQQFNVWKNAAKKALKAGVLRKDFPNCVAIVDGPAFLTDRNEIANDSSKKVTIRAYDCGNASAAIFLSHLYDSIVLQGKDSTRRGEWFQMLTQVCKGTPLTQPI